LISQFYKYLAFILTSCMFKTFVCVLYPVGFLPIETVCAVFMYCILYIVLYLYLAIWLLPLY